MPILHKLTGKVLPKFNPRQSILELIVFIAIFIVVIAIYSIFFAKQEVKIDAPDDFTSFENDDFLIFYPEEQDFNINENPIGVVIDNEKDSIVIEKNPDPINGKIDLGDCKDYLKNIEFNNEFDVSVVSYDGENSCKFEYSDDEVFTVAYIIQKNGDSWLVSGSRGGASAKDASEKLDVFKAIRTFEIK